MYRTILILLAPYHSLTSCIYDDYSSCPPKDGRRLVRINVDWRLFDKEVPTGMTVMVFPWSGGAPHTALTNDITHADFSLEPGNIMYWYSTRVRPSLVHSTF